MILKEDNKNISHIKLRQFLQDESENKNAKKDDQVVHFNSNAVNKIKDIQNQLAAKRLINESENFYQSNSSKEAKISNEIHYKLLVEQKRAKYFQEKMQGPKESVHVRLIDNHHVDENE